MVIVLVVKVVWCGDKILQWQQQQYQGSLLIIIEHNQVRYDTLVLLLLAMTVAVLALDEGLLVNPPLPGTNSFAPTFNFVTTEAALLLLPPSVVVAATAADDALCTNSLLLLLLLLLIRTKKK